MTGSFFDFELLTKVEGHVLILLSLGLLGIRYFFHDQEHHEQRYRFIHIFILMVFTIYALELLIVMIGFFLYYDAISFEQMSQLKMKLYIYVPKFIFYSTLCYFIYWILRMFQQKNSITKSPSEDQESGELLLKLMKHPEFKLEYLEFPIYYQDQLIWKGAPLEKPILKQEDVQIESFRIHLNVE